MAIYHKQDEFEALRDELVSGKIFRNYCNYQFERKIFNSMHMLFIVPNRKSVLITKLEFMKVKQTIELCQRN